MEPIYAGIDIGGTSAKIGLVTRGGRVLSRRRVPQADGLSARELVDLYCAAIDGLLAEAEGGAAARRRVGQGGGPLATLAGIGVGIPGYVTAAGLPELTNVRALDGYPLVSHLAGRYGVPVAVDNDANAALLAEHEFGAGRGARRPVLVAVGYGIGVGAMADGLLVRFTGGTTGNLGHAIVDPASEDRCGLGCRGCLETRATAPALERRAVRLARERPRTPLGRRLAETGRVTAADVKAAADAGDPEAVGLLTEAGRWLGVGLATFAAALSPDIILIGGGMSEMGATLIEAAATVFREVAMPYVRGARVAPAALGNDAGLIGAACGLWRGPAAEP